MRALLLTLFLLTAVPASAETLLRLSETAHVMVKPDELVAVLCAEGTGATAAAAQAQANTMVRRTLDAVAGKPGIAATTGGYGVWQRAKPSPQWIAVQSITLKSADGPTLLALVGTLQAGQLALERLSWQVSPAAARRALSEATKQALGALRGRSEAAAAILGLAFTSFREIRIQDQPRPMVLLGARAMAAPTEAAPPSAEAEDADIVATVEADAVLSPP
ncbi:MAG: SIMPL domain-containing protein [Alphaproteobacteria bacterium]|nr:SIMPL domain-containing protein [Alphaproteobacteria bacterium]